MHNRQAVADWLKIVINLLVRSLWKFSLEPEIRLLSIASGSAQAVVMAIKKSGLTNVRVVLIDNDRTAIDEAKRLVASEMLTNKSTFHVGTTAAVSRQQLRAWHEFATSRVYRAERPREEDPLVPVSPFPLIA